MGKPLGGLGFMFIVDPSLQARSYHRDKGDISRM